jgi:hypothetical protein
MVKSDPYKVNVCSILVLLLISISCNNNSTEKIPIEQKKDTNNSINKTIADSLLGKATTPKEILLDINANTLTEDQWTTTFSMDICDFVFSKDFSLVTWYTTKEYMPEKITYEWVLRKDSLFIIENTDTLKYRITKITPDYVELKVVDDHNKKLFGEKSLRDDGAFYNFIYREKINLPFLENDLIGEWASGDDFTFSGDGTFIYHDPPCGDDVTGTWQIKKDNLSLNFIKTPCNQKNYESKYKVMRASRHWLVLKDSKDVFWFRYKY